MNVSIAVELRNILACYDLGVIVDYEQDQRGYVNTSFMIQMEKNGERKKYFLRRYKKEISEEEIIFEHTLIKHLAAKGFSLVARVIEDRHGNTYLHISRDEQGQNGVFYAIFDFLGGEDRYTWISPVCTPTEIASSAEVLAEFHRRACDLVPQGRRAEPNIRELLQQIEAILDDALLHKPEGLICRYLKESANLIRASIENTNTRLAQQSCDSMIELVIHCDFHPGNLKFDGEQVVGLFDFDWSKVDLRVYDVGMALWYFFACWDPERDGSMRLEDVELFLVSYQDALKKLPGLTPMTEPELNCLSQMISAANLYVLNWTLHDFLNKEIDEEIYLGFVKHHVNTIRWLDNPINQEKVNRTLSRARVD